MKSRTLLMLLSLYMCGTASGSEGNIQEFVNTEVDEMLNDKEAFPVRSKQYNELLRFKHEVARMSGGTSKDHRSPKGQTDQKAHKHKGKHEDEEMTHPEEESPKQSTKKARSGTHSYEDVMSRHSELDDEREQVTKLHQELSDNFDDLNAQLAEIKSYRSTTQHTKAEDQEHMAALKRYNQDFQARKELESAYKEALDKYNQNKKGYAKMLKAHQGY